MTGVQPTDHDRRSPLHRVLSDAGARFVARDGAAVAIDFGEDSDAASARARICGLADLSVLARTGFKGADTPTWLEDQGIDIPARPNAARRQADGTLVARLSEQEHLVLSAPDGDRAPIDRLEAAWSLDTAGRCYLLPRQDSHAWLALSGVRAPSVMAKICGVDLRTDKFTDGQIAQTSVARVNAIVIRAGIAATPVFFILVDSASATYFWPCLIDAMHEFDGGPVGLSALSRLLAAEDT